jgi:hypothetical protein
MNKSLKLGVALCLVGGVALAWTMSVKRAAAATSEKYIHVRVNDPSKGEMVSVNVPLSLAEKIIPTIHNEQLHDGKVTIEGAEVRDVDVRALLAAVADAPDNEFVTVKERDQEVHVAKSKGNFIIHVDDSSGGSGEKAGKHNEKVDITVPISVVKAMIPDKNQDLDLVAALHELSEAGSSLLVTVHDGTQDVRIWIDSENNGEK